MNRAAHHMKIQLHSLLICTLVGLTSTMTFAQESQPENPAPQSQPDTLAPFHFVQMKTSLGDIIFQLNYAKAPISVENFLKYVEQERYDGTIFHRVMPNFMIQGGAFTKDMGKKQANDPIKNEWQNGLKNMRGSIAMARLPGRADSATNQFFINTVDNASLDVARDGSGYAVFGKVIGGMDTVDAIRTTPTTTTLPSKGGPGMMQNVPVTPIVIESVRKITPEEAEALEGKSLKKSDTPTSKPGE
ncbi:MAG: peptidylprolyl isomerase [Planctomycetota bacterium]|nr:peptidylprolyl isomerase [Planctomycetota bacterium]